eukprot:TRINITY_DN13638_c0_g1_i1.p1 TRINITY_DN13638_c0_g1~~TRINITY_DN13638_c0_g1_i1.p1  ORF type:complete len:394 (+),score=69.70 TRINITY_DN13638_c0_g1_i1:823-2004(+)
MGCGASAPAVETDVPSKRSVQEDKSVSSHQNDDVQTPTAGLSSATKVEDIGGVSRSLDKIASNGPAAAPSVTTLPPARRMVIKELAYATDNFSPSRLLGEGTLGSVYWGTILDPTFKRTGPGGTPDKSATKWMPKPGEPTVKVAIKKLFHSAFDGYKNYLNEVLVLDKLRHPNMVQLIGYCHEKEEAMLVYNFCEHGSLKSVLANGSKDGEALSWSVRVGIAMDIAQGLQIMHANNIIHRDLKANNILLGKDFKAQIGDFGLARAGPDGTAKHVSTKVQGTLGYLDPTYMETGRLTQGSDVYAYGVILLEIVTGKPSSMADTANLVSEMRPYLDDIRTQIFDVVDPLLGGNYSKPGVCKLAYIAKACLNAEPERRPKTADIVRTIDKVDRDNF